MFGFSVPQGGVVCGACIRKGTATHRATSDTLFLLNKWQTMSIEQGVSIVDGKDRRVREGQKILEDFLAYHVGRELRSLRVMREVLSDRSKG